MIMENTMQSPRIMNAKRLQASIINSALGGIEEIRPLIHKVIFFGNYNFGEIERSLGKIRVLSPEEKQKYKKREPGYRDVGYCQIPFAKFIVYYNPKKNFFPWCRIHTSQSNPKVFSFLIKALPRLKISSMEYAIDFFCKDNDSASDLFYLLRRYMFFPNAKKIRLICDSAFGWREPRKINAVFKIYFAAGGKHNTKATRVNTYAKIYERGDDNAGFKNREGWPQRKVDRVRLEFAFRRTALRKIGIESLGSLFVHGPKFYEACAKRIQFKNFKPSSPYPKDWEDYLATDNSGNMESLQEEILKAKREGKRKNPYQCLEDTPRLMRLKKKILRAIKQYDDEWLIKCKMTGIYDDLFL
jgi:hypothetical protein